MDLERGDENGSGGMRGMMAADGSMMQGGWQSMMGGHNMMMQDPTMMMGNMGAGKRAYIMVHLFGQEWKFDVGSKTRTSFLCPDLSILRESFYRTIFYDFFSPQAFWL